MFWNIWQFLAGVRDRFLACKLPGYTYIWYYDKFIEKIDIFSNFPYRYYTNMGECVVIEFVSLWKQEITSTDLSTQYSTNNNRITKWQKCLLWSNKSWACEPWQSLYSLFMLARVSTHCQRNQRILSTKYRKEYPRVRTSFFIWR